jgi:hypothetical protein
VTGVNLGTYDQDRVGFRPLIYIELSSKNSSATKKLVSNFYYDGFNYIDFSQNAPYHFFRNNLMQNAQNNKSVLRDSIFPFKNQIPENIFKATQDSIFNTYGYGFYEDWNFDETNFVFTKKVKAICFLNNNSYVSKRVAAYAFADYTDFFDVKNTTIVLESVNSKSKTILFDVGITKEDSLTYSKLDAFGIRIMEEIENGKRIAYLSDPWGLKLSKQLTLAEYNELQKISVTIPIMDSIGNMLYDTTLTSITKETNSIGLCQNIVWDFNKGKIKSQVTSLSFNQFRHNREKERFYYLKLNLQKTLLTNQKKKIY